MTPVVRSSRESEVPRRSVLVITDDVLSETMAGPAIRAWNIASTLAMHHDVRLASTTRAEASSPHFAVCDGRPDVLQGLARHQDVIVVQGFTLAKNPWLAATGARLVVDLYDPIHLEILEMAREETPQRRAAMLQASLRAIEVQMEAGDFFLAASERQRDFWLGHLAAAGRVNAKTYEQDPTLRQLIDVAPFGIPAQDPKAGVGAIRGQVAGIGANDQVLLWGGGVYNWFDPVTLVRAMSTVTQKVPAARLLFMGTRHPSMDDPGTAALREAIAEARRLELLDESVFFAEGWVPYDQRHRYLLDADLGVSTHRDHVETAFSFRTRMLDYLWAGLPIVCSEGDVFADLVADRGLGRAVPPNDEVALATAIVELLSDPEELRRCRSNVEKAASAYRWEASLRPLVSFCDQPWRAADMAAGVSGIGPASRLGMRVDAAASRIEEYVAVNGWRRLASRVAYRVWNRITQLASH